MDISKEALGYIKNIIDGYEGNVIQLIDGLNFCQYQVLRKIEFYWNSQYINGNKDDIGRIKPFYNISKFRVNVATRATDLDIKDVKVTSDDPADRVRSLIFNKEIYNWMKDVNFGKTLNKSGHTRAKYGGVLIKKVMNNGNIDVQVVEWKNVITDSTDILGGVIIEKHYMSPSELSKKRGVWENVEEAMKLAVRKSGDNETTEFKVPVYEVHGEFPETFDTDVIDGDETNFKRMMFYIAGEDCTVPLWKEDEKELPYKFLAWDEVSGRGLGIGIVEDGFEAQMWTNDAIIAEKNVMDLAGKIFIKTTSEKFGNNIITEAETGQVFNIEDGADAEIMNLVPSSLPEFQNLVEKWNTQYERATNTFESVSGETLPSNTPLGSVAIQTAQASSFFDYRREEAGIFWREVFNDWILPVIAKKITKSHILASDYSMEELELIANTFALNQAGKKVEEYILSGKAMYQEDYESLIEANKKLIQERGSYQYLDIPDGYFTNFKPKLTIDLTGESKNKQEQLTSLFNVLTQIASNPALLQDPNLMQVFSQMLELSNIRFTPKINTQPIQGGQGKQLENNIPALEQQTKSVLPQAQQ